MTAFSGSFFEGPILESPHSLYSYRTCLHRPVRCQRVEQLVGGFLARQRGRGNEEEKELSASISFLLAFLLSLPEFCPGLARPRAPLLEVVQAWLLISNSIWESL